LLSGGHEKIDKRDLKSAITGSIRRVFLLVLGTCSASSGSDRSYRCSERSRDQPATSALSQARGSSLCRPDFTVAVYTERPTINSNMHVEKSYPRRASEIFIPAKVTQDAMRPTVSHSEYNSYSSYSDSKIVTKN
ncbi:hypothetical protein DBV15_04348, partial [Temnothorax longispinosus]